MSWVNLWLMFCAIPPIFHENCRLLSICRSSFSAEYLCSVWADIKPLVPFQHICSWLRTGAANIFMQTQFWCILKATFSTQYTRVKIIPIVRMFYFFIPNRHRTSCRVDKIYQERGVVSSCSAQTRSGISLLGNFLRQKPLGVRASYAAHAQTQVWSEQVWLNTTFISRGLQSWDKLAVET
jgi:hypothetical protein